MSLERLPVKALLPSEQKEMPQSTFHFTLKLAKAHPVADVLREAGNFAVKILTATCAYQLIQHSFIKQGAESALPKALDLLRSIR